MSNTSTYVGRMGHARGIASGFQDYLTAIVAILLRVSSGPTASISYFVLAVFALAGRGQAILALVLSWLFTMINPAIVPAGDGGGAGRYLVILAAAITALFRKSHQKRLGSFTVVTALLSVFLIFHSILFSAIPDVSILKALSWGVAMASLISLWQGLSPQGFHAMEHRVYCCLLLVLFTSLPFLIHPAGFATNGTGFQGILNHPQAFGSTMAVLGAWSGARMFATRKPTWISIAVTGSCLALILLSEARTGGLSMILGLGISLLLSPMFSGRKFVELAPGFGSGRVWAVAGLSGLIIVVMAARFHELIASFMSKSGRANSSNLFEAYDASRGFLIDSMLLNITNTPFRGIGFGIASFPSSMIVERDPIFGLPLGASIEKGVAPLAVLEEVGVFGFFLVGLWLFRLLREGAFGGLAAFSVCLAALALNMGENTLFSPGGQGMLAMVLFGWCYANGHRRRYHV